MTSPRIIATGSYTTTGSGRGKGVELLRWTPAADGSGAGEAERLAQLELEDPSFLLWSRAGDLLYAITETSPSRLLALRPADDLASLEIAAELVLSGSGGCHLALGAVPGTLIVAEYGSGHVETVRLDDSGLPVEIHDCENHHDFADGRTPHPHQAVVLPTTSLIAVPDLGLDRVMVYRQSRDGSLELSSEVSFQRGIGPRHLVSDAEAHELHIAGEGLGGLATAVRRASTGRAITGAWTEETEESLTWAVTSAVPGSEREGLNNVSHVEMTDDEHLVLVANRGPDTLAAFDRGGQIPQLCSEIEVGAHPRHFAQIGRTILVAAQEADRIDQIRLEGRRLVIAGAAIPSPSVSCIAPRPERG